MAGARINDFGSIWKTIREVDITAIRQEADHDVVVACAGDRAAVERLRELLLEGPDRYPTPYASLGLVPLDQVAARERLISDADLLLVALHDDVTLSPAERTGLERLQALSPRRRLLVVLGDPSASSRSVLRRVDEGRSLVLRPKAADARERLAEGVLDALPKDRRLAAARRLPGLRPRYAHQLTGEVSLSNGAFVLASGIPSLVPVLGVPIAAADTLVLTKNQALMVYRLALAFGAPSEFQKRMMEITPVIGAAVMWRQVAGGLVGLIPGYGIVPKTAVAFAGTWITGRAAELYYATGFVAKEDLRRFSDEAMARAKAMTGEMARRAREARDATRRAGEAARGVRGATARLREGGGRLREGAGRLVPRRRLPPAPSGGSADPGATGGAGSAADETAGPAGDGVAGTRRAPQRFPSSPPDPPSEE